MAEMQILQEQKSAQERGVKESKNVPEHIKIFSRKKI
jgi:hypothetical protein